MARYAGKNLAVYMSKSAVGEAENVPHVSQWTNSGDVDFHEVSGSGDVTKTYVAGLPDAGGTISSFWDNEDDVIPSAVQSTKDDTPVKLYLYRSMSVPTQYLYGTAWVSISEDVGINAAITRTINWRPASPITDNA